MKTIYFAFLALLIIACGGGSGSKGQSNSPKDKNIIEEGRFMEASSIDDEFNPDVFEAGGLMEDSIREIHLPSSFSGVRIRYNSKLPLRSFAFKAITVVKNGQRPQVSPSINDEQIHLGYLSPNGSYQCSMSSTNGEIGWVEGGCLVSFELQVNPKDRVEVFYNGKRLTSAKFGMKYEAFFEAYDREFEDKNKHKLLKEFINSYRLRGDKLALSAKQVEEIVGEMGPFDGLKLPNFKLVHGFVSDRESLRRVIDGEFSFDEKDEAYRIAGLQQD